MAALLSSQNKWKHADEIAARLRSAAKASPRLAGDAYIDHLVRQHDAETIGD